VAGPIKTIDGGQEINELFFSDVRVPANQLVGQENSTAGRTRNSCWANERTGIAGVAGQSAARRGEKARADTGVLDDPLFAARLAEAENELLALELTQATSGVGLLGRRAQPGVVVLKLRGSQLQQVATEFAGRGGRPRRAGPLMATKSLHPLGADQRPTLPSTTARRRSTAAAAKYSATSSRRPFSDCEAAMDFQLSDEQACSATPPAICYRAAMTRKAATRSSAPISAGARGLEPAGRHRISASLRSGRVRPRSRSWWCSPKSGDGWRPNRVVHAALAPGALIAERASEEQKRLLDDVAAGQRLLAFAHLEAATASRPRTSPPRPCGKAIRGR